MVKKLGRKQSLSNEDWLNTTANIESLVTFEEISAVEQQAVADILAQAKGKKVAYAWSGGKDSIVLGALCEQAGITDCVLGISNLEFPAFLDWVDKNKPAGLEIMNTGIDMEWLAKNQHLIFPDAPGLARWCEEIHIKVQTLYFRQQNLDMLLLGRRKAEGNFCGRGGNIYTNGKGITYFSPLSDWSHEHILAYIHYNKLPLPPFYEWVNGYKRGTHAWPMRPGCKTKEEGWRETYIIAPEIVKAAAEHIESAKAFLEGVE